MDAGKWLILLVVLVTPSLVAAELYKYTDKHGTVHFTDNLANVPVDQRSSVKSYKEIRVAPSQQRTAPGENKQPGTAERTPESSSDLVEQKGTQTTPSEQQAVAQRLSTTRKALDREYRQLSEESETIAKQRRGCVTDTCRKKYNDKAKSLNRRIEAYENKRRTFDKEVEAFNARTSGDRSAYSVTIQ
ncbi:MAG: DUF4124 domain-containing protein [Deltaproteobacteria bacterium]|nr:MAG: DUF4124 domain-containing protein [Deltaproteobacteria bacterium]